MFSIGLYRFLSMFILYIVLFFNVRLEVRPSLESLFLCSVVVVVVGMCIADIVVAVGVRILNMCI